MATIERHFFLGATLATVVTSIAHGATTILPSLRSDLGFSQHYYGNGLAVGGATTRVWGVHADGGTIYATGDAGLNYSTNGGATWNYYQNDSFRYQSLSVYASGNSIYTAGAYGVRYSHDGGATWNSANVGWNSFASAVWAEGSAVYATWQNGISISNDGGATWTDRPIYQPNRGLVWDVSNVRAQGGKIYATSREGVCTSSDGGVSWQVQQISAYQGAYGLSVSDDVMYVGSGGGLYKSTDGGSTWSFVWNGASSGVFSVFRYGNSIYGSLGSQGRDGTFISTDGGTTFRMYSESAYSVFADGSKAYFAGSSMLLIGSAVPAPGAIALLGVAGVASGRRRRA